MSKLGRFFKSAFVKVFLILFILACAIGIFFYWGWFERQFDKGLGMYYVYKGDKAYRKAELQQAIDNYNRGLELYPGHYGAQFNLGNIYVVYEDYYSAADSYAKAIELNKNFTLARMNLGIVSAEKIGDFDGAIAQYQAIINSRKRLWFIPFIFRNTRSEKINRGLAYYNMGLAYRQKAMYTTDNPAEASHCIQEAIRAYKNAARILKKDYDTRYNLALVYHLNGDYQNAGINYCKAIELQPMEYEAHYNLAILLKHLKMYRESLNELEKATMLVSTDSSNSNTASYIFAILNEVSKTLVQNNQYDYLVEKIDNEPSKTAGITYVHGKIVATEELDKAMLKNFRTCETKDYFNNEESYEKILRD